MSKNKEWLEPEDVHEYIFDLTDLDHEELAQAMQAIVQHLGLDVFRTNRNKHQETRIEVRKEKV